MNKEKVTCHWCKAELKPNQVQVKFNATCCKNEKECDKRTSIATLKSLVKKDSTVYCILKHVSRTGMYRHIALLVSHKKEVVNISYWAAKALGWRNHEGAIGVGGCGMDMGFHAVHTLGSVLFKNGYKLKSRWI